MKRLFALFLAAVMALSGCSEKRESGANEIDGMVDILGTGDTDGGSIAPTAGASSDKLTSTERDSYQFLLPNDNGDPVEITDEVIINELWIFLEECENGERCRFSKYGDELSGVKGETTLILKDKATGAEYNIAAGFPFRCKNAKDDEPVIRISGYRAEGDLLWAAYKDEFGRFGYQLNGLADRISFDHPALLTDGNFEEYEFTGTLESYDRETLSGTISASAAKRIWELVSELEHGGERSRDDISGYGKGNAAVTARNTVTGETTLIYNGSVGLKPAELEVDDSVIYVGDRIYPAIYIGSEGIYADVMLSKLVEEGLSGGNDNGGAPQVDYEKITDGVFEEFEIYGSVDDNYGEITGEVKRWVWDKLAEIESAAPSKLTGSASTGGCCNDRLILTHVPTGKTYRIRDGIYYASPELDGGPSVVELEGTHGVFYWGSLHETFDKIREELNARQLSPAKLTDNAFEDFEFSGSAETYDGATLTTTRYSGKVPEETARKVWEFLNQIENTGHFDYDDNDYAGSYGDCFIIRNKYTDREYRFARGILYDNPGEDGGASVYVLLGMKFGKRDYSCYGKNIGVDNYYSYADRFDELIAEGIVREENVAEIVTDHPAPSKSDIVLVRNCRNWAWGYQNSGSFVDLSGNIYEFDIADIPWEVIGTDDDFIALLEKMHYNHEFGDPIGTVEDTDMLRDITALADRVSPNAKITEKHAAYDAGQWTLYAVNSEHTPVMISSTGDFDRVNTDLNAIKIALKCSLNKIF
ncbi:MAG: hypothetical protein K2N38_03810 [Oscillospiraceae bacterium]|nr:hypothetical protein [Oscillospiraceae bacterium]